MAKRLTLALIGTAAAVAFGGAGEAKADAYAYSYFNVTAELTLADGTPVTPGDFASLNIANSASDFAQLAGPVSGVDGDQATSAGDVSIAPAFVGSGGIGDNAWAPSGLGPNYARSDADLTGSILTGGALSQTVGEALVDGSAGQQLGSTSAFTDTTTEFVFSLTQDAAFLFTGAYTYSLVAQLTELSAFLQNATAEIDFGLEIFDLGPAITDAETPIFETTIASSSRSRNTIGTSTGNVADVPFSVLTPTLTAGIFYRGVITQTSETDVVADVAVQVPEPGTLGLLGGGLLAFGAAGAWRRRQDARDAG